MDHVQDIKVSDFKELLFSQPSPPSPNSMSIDVQFEENDTTMYHFLSEVFAYGMEKKFGHIPKDQLTMEEFEVIRSYIKAIGFETRLIDIELGENDKVTGIKIQFEILY